MIGERSDSPGMYIAYNDYSGSDRLSTIGSPGGLKTTYDTLHTMARFKVGYTCSLARRLSDSDYNTGKDPGEWNYLATVETETSDDAHELEQHVLGVFKDYRCKNMYDKTMLEMLENVEHVDVVVCAKEFANANNIVCNVVNRFPQYKTQTQSRSAETASTSPCLVEVSPRLASPSQLVSPSQLTSSPQLICSPRSSDRSRSPGSSGQPTDRSVSPDRSRTPSPFEDIGTEQCDMMIPRSYQVDAVRNIQRGFTRHNAAILSLPCRTGKTFVSWLVWARARPRYWNTLVIVNGITLARQWKDELSRYWYQAKNETDGIQRQPAVMIFGSGSGMMSDGQGLAESIDAKNRNLTRTITICVINSVEKLASIQFGFTIFDEAHHCPNSSVLWPRLLKSSLLGSHSSHRLFLTATPVFGNDTTLGKTKPSRTCAAQKWANCITNVRESANAITYAAGDTDALQKALTDARKNHQSSQMSIQNIYGSLAYRYSLRQAIEDGHAHPYRLKLLAMDFQGGDMMSAMADGLMQTIDCNYNNDISQKNMRSRSCLVFCRKIDSARSFAKAIKNCCTMHNIPHAMVEDNVDVLEKMADSVEERPQDRDQDRAVGEPVSPTVYVVVITQEDDPHERLRNAMRRILKADNHPPIIICNCNIFREGIELPMLDSIMFTSYYESIVFIIQAVCRALTKMRNKRTAQIIIPIDIISNGAQSSEHTDAPRASTGLCAENIDMFADDAITQGEQNNEHGGSINGEFCSPDDPDQKDLNGPGGQALKALDEPRGRVKCLLAVICALGSADQRLFDYIIDPAHNPFPIDWTPVGTWRAIGLRALMTREPHVWLKRARGLMRCRYRKSGKRSKTNSDDELFLDPEAIPFDNALTMLSKYVYERRRYPKCKNAREDMSTVIHLGEAFVSLNDVYKVLCTRYGKWSERGLSRFDGGLEDEEAFRLQSLPKWHDLYQYKYDVDAAFETLRKWYGGPLWSEHKLHFPFNLSGKGCTDIDRTEFENVSGVVRVINQQDRSYKKDDDSKIASEKIQKLDEFCETFGFMWRNESTDMYGNKAKADGKNGTHVRLFFQGSTKGWFDQNSDGSFKYSDTISVLFPGMPIRDKIQESVSFLRDQAFSPGADEKFEQHAKQLTAEMKAWVDYFYPGSGKSWIAKKDIPALVFLELSKRVSEDPLWQLVIRDGAKCATDPVFHPKQIRSLLIEQGIDKQLKHKNSIEFMEHQYATGHGPPILQSQSC